jgi:hypothetical protein
MCSYIGLDSGLLRACQNCFFQSHEGLSLVRFTDDDAVLYNKSRWDKQKTILMFLLKKDAGMTYADIAKKSLRNYFLILSANCKGVVYNFQPFAWRFLNCLTFIIILQSSFACNLQNFLLILSYGVLMKQSF